MAAQEAERLIADGSVDRADVTKTLKPKPGEDLRDVGLRLERFPKVKATIEYYIARTWTEWAQAERPRRESIDIYDRLFSVQQAVKLEGADRPVEIVWGIGVARWKVPPHELDHPIVEQLVELELDETGAILVRPRGLDPIMALKPFAAMENSATDLVARFARDHFAKLPPDQDLSPFVKETFAPILRYACAEFDRSGRYYPDQTAPDDRKVPEAGSSLIVTDTWVLYARPRSDNFFIADLDRLKKAIEDSDSLPGPAVALVTEPSDEPTYVKPVAGIRVGGEAQSGGADGQLNAGVQASDGRHHRYFFPKAFNDEQIAIIERLESPDVEGVVVQGPPGTGKTHTIANIICHYLATGRRVLVTSQSEGPLAVLRDQIPDGIRDLSISLLTSEREGLRQLEATVSLLASKIASLDTRMIGRDIAESEQRIAELQRRIDRIDTELLASAEKHLRRVGADKSADGMLPIELAEHIVRNQSRFEWFMDRPTLEPQFTDADIATARDARKALGVDLDYLSASLPSSSDLPDAATLAAIHRDLANAASIERDRRPDAPVMSLSEADALARAEVLIVPIKSIVAVHEVCRDAPWLANLFAAWNRYGFDADPVRPLSTLIAGLSDTMRRRTTIASYAVLTSDDAHTKAELIAAVERAASGQRPFGFVSWGEAEVRTAFAAIRMLGRPPQRPDQWQKVLEVLTWRNEFGGRLSQWEALAPEFRLPPVPYTLDEAVRAILEVIKSANLIADCIRLHLPFVRKEINRLFPYGLDAAQVIDDISQAQRAEEAIRSELLRCRLNGARTKLDTTKDKLASCNGRVTEELKEFVSNVVGLPERHSRPSSR